MANNEEKAKMLKLLANKYILNGKEITPKYKAPFCYFAKAKKMLAPSNQRIIQPPDFKPKKIPSSTDDNTNSSRRFIWGG